MSIASSSRVIEAVSFSIFDINLSFATVWTDLLQCRMTNLISKMENERCPDYFLGAAGVEEGLALLYSFMKSSVMSAAGAIQTRRLPLSATWRSNAITMLRCWQY